jgi:hypothetical protein
LEEAGYIPDMVIKDIVLPLLAKETASFLCLSTKSHNTTNFFNAALRSGRFRTYEVKFVCSECLKLPTPPKSVCKHERDSVTHWSSEGRIELIRELMGEDDAARFEIEALGLDPNNPNSQVFSQDMIDGIFTKPRVTIPSTARFIFVFMDPSAGSNKPSDKHQSHMAITSIIAKPGMVLAGLESIPINGQPSAWQVPLRNHIRALRALPNCENAKIVFGVESNNASYAGTVETFVQTEFNNVVFMQDLDDLPGCQMDSKAKIDMIHQATALARSGALDVHCDLVTSHPEGREKIISIFKEQMLNFKRLVKKNPSGSETVTYSGKSGSKRDDLSVSFQWAALCIHNFFSQNKYVRYQTSMPEAHVPLTRSEEAKRVRILAARPQTIPGAKPLSMPAFSSFTR